MGVRCHVREQLQMVFNYEPSFQILLLTLDIQALCAVLVRQDNPYQRQMCSQDMLVIILILP